MIGIVRQALFDHLAPLAVSPTGPSVSGALALRRWLPEDVAELPCAVVGRPDVRPSVDGNTLYDLDTPVYVVGRRLDDDDAQAELDLYTDLVIGRFTQKVVGLFGPVNTRSAPTSVLIAQSEYPAYIVTLTTTYPLPCP